MPKLKNKMTASKSKKNGFSLVESLVGLALLAIISYSVITMFTGTMKQAKRIANNGACEQFNQKVFSQISLQKLSDTDPGDFLKPKMSLKTLGPVTENYIKIPDLDPYHPKIRPALEERFKIFSLTSSDLYQLNGKPALAEINFMNNNGVTSYMPLLANNQMGYLADLYNHYFKLHNFQSIPPDLVVNVLPSAVLNSIPKRKSTDILIDLYDREAPDKMINYNNPLNPIPFPIWPMPAAQFRESSSQITKFSPFTKNQIKMAEFPDWMTDKYGFRVTLKTTLDIDGKLDDCVSVKDFSYAPDLQNVISYSDFEVVRYNGTGGFNAANLRDDTLNSSNKGNITDSSTGQPLKDTSPLAPIFTNFNAQYPNQGRDRNECSQDGSTIRNFYIKFRITGLNKESGVIPLCLDNSKQWLAQENPNNSSPGGGWCTSNYYTGGPSDSRMPIIYDWKPAQTGWVPCENLSFCGVKPTNVEIVPIADPNLLITTPNGLEYRYYYDVDLNSKTDNPQKGLWGCELKYMAATVDVAGNASYPPALKPNDTTTPLTTAQLITASGTRLNVEPVREINPRVYFKPPPCYTCTCKSCKGGSGGFLSGFFKIFLVIVLAAVTGGASLYTIPGLLAGSVLTVACIAGNMGCAGGPSSTEPGLTTTTTGYSSCRDVDKSCGSCGHTCTKHSPPGPRWYDSLVASSQSNPLIQNGCQIKSFSKSFSLGPPFNAIMGNKAELIGTPTNSDQYELVPNSANMIDPPDKTKNMYYVNYDIDDAGKPQVNTVMSGEETQWQSFDKNAGIYCIVQYQCNQKLWVQYPRTVSYDVDPYDFASANPPQTHQLGLLPEGCFRVKTAHLINWNSPTTNTDGTLGAPALGINKCLEVDFPNGYFNETGDTLAGTTGTSKFNTALAGTPATCGLVADLGSSQPPDVSTPGKRVVGKPSNYCVQTIDFGGDVGAVNLAYPTDPIAPPDADGIPQFQCWRQCIPPARIPEFTNTNPDEKQYYYQQYDSTKDSGLPFCTLNRKTFDVDP